MRASFWKAAVPEGLGEIVIRTGSGGMVNTVVRGGGLLVIVFFLDLNC